MKKNIPFKNRFATLRKEIQSYFMNGFLYAVIGGGITMIFLLIKDWIVEFWTPLTELIIKIDGVPSENIFALILSFVLTALAITILGFVVKHRKTLFEKTPLVILGWVLKKIPLPIKINVGPKTIVSQRQVDKWTPVLIPDASFGRLEPAFAVKYVSLYLHDSDEEKPYETIDMLAVFKPGSWPTIFVGKMAFVTRREVLILDSKQTTTKEIVNFLFTFGESDLELHALLNKNAARPSWLIDDIAEKLLGIVNKTKK